MGLSCENPVAGASIKEVCVINVYSRYNKTSVVTELLRMYRVRRYLILALVGA